MKRQHWTQKKILESVGKMVQDLGYFPSETQYRSLRTSTMIMPKAVSLHFNMTWATFGETYFDYITKSNRMIKCCCLNCGKSFDKYQNQVQRSPNHFCSRSCAATYNNTHKTKGIRRSKLEQWIEEQLNALYPDLEIHYNRKDAINAELDIYIPSMKLAFELNGIFHYEPIYGKDKLDQIQENDQRKHQSCYEAGIEICWIDSSGLKYFKEANARKYLDIICGAIDQNNHQ